MRNKTWWAFVGFQGIGEICHWSWPAVSSAIGPVLWGGAFLLLLPGNVVSSYLVERLLWRTSVTLFQMQLLQAPLTLGINFAVWVLGAWAWRRLISTFRRRVAGTSTQ